MEKINRITTQKNTGKTQSGITAGIRFLFNSVSEIIPQLTGEKPAYKKNLLPGKFTILALLCLLMTGNMAAQSSRVQYATGNTGSAAVNSFTVTLASTPVIGNTLIVVVSTRSISTSRTSTLSQTNVTWPSTPFSLARNTNGSSTEIFYAPVSSTSAGTTVTIALNYGTTKYSAAAVVMEYKGLLTSDVKGSHPNGSAWPATSKPTTGTPWDGSKYLSTTQDNELWIGGISIANSGASLSNIFNDFTTIANITSGSTTATDNTRLYALEKIVDYKQVPNSGGILDNNYYWAGALATFKLPIVAAPYCEIAGTSIPKGWASTLITGADGYISTIPVNVGSSSSTIYKGVINSFPIDVFPEQNITINPTSTSSGFNGLNCFFYADWNGDTDFDDPGEYLGKQLSTVGASSRTLAVSVPADAKFGTTRVRIMFSKDTDINKQPCTITDKTNAMVCDFNIKIKQWCPPDVVGKVINESCPEVKDGAITVDNVNAIDFKNKDIDYVDFGKSLMDSINQFTLECWVKFKYEDNDQAIIDLSGDRLSGGIIGQNNDAELFISKGKLRLWAIHDDDIVDIDLTTHSIGNNVWHHIAGVGESGTLKVYVDGKLVGAQSNSNNYTTLTPYKPLYCKNKKSKQIAKLGSYVSTPIDGTTAADAAFNGLIAKAGFWKRALNADSIKILANNFHTYSTADVGLLAGYNFFEEKGTAINGISTVSAAPTGTFVYSPVWKHIFSSWCANSKGEHLLPDTTTNFLTNLTSDTYTYHIQGVTCTEKTKDFFVDIDYTCPNLWVGSTSTDWAHKYNWSGKFVPFAEDEDPTRITPAKYASIPGSAKNVVFATTANNTIAAQNDLILDKKRSVCGDFTNESNKTLIIPPAKSLTINGTAKTNAFDRILIQGDTIKANGSLIFTKPELNPAVKATVQMITRGFQNKNNPWTWYDPDNVKYTGTYRWQFFGVPVNSTDILYNNMSLWGSYIRKYDEKKDLNLYYQKWTTVGNNDKLTPFAGYEITQAVPKTISFQGTLVTGDQKLKLTKTTGTGPLNYGSGYNIFGNSFTAAIDISKIQFPATGVDKTVYLYYTGSLADWGNNGQTLPTTFSGSCLAGSYYAMPFETSKVIGKEIPSMQGFLLKTTTDGAEVTIPYSTTTGISATANTVIQHIKQATASSGELSYMTLDVLGQNGADRVWLFSQPGTSHGFDNGWDGEKLMITNNVALYAAEESGNYQVNTADELEGTYLAFKAGADTEYTLIINKRNLSGYETLYLTDLTTGDEIDLSPADSVNYSFTASNTTSFDKRFLLSRTRKIGTGTNVSDKSQLKIYSSGKFIRIQNSRNENGSVRIFEVTGKQLYTGMYQANTTTEINTGLLPGAYLVKLKSANNCMSQTVMIVE